MIILHQFPAYFGLPNASPFCMKVESYLRLSGLDYQIANIRGDLRSTPRGKAPYITDKGQDIADSYLILEYLKETYGDPLGKGLDDHSRANHAATRHMLEDHLYFIILSERWTIPGNMEKLRETFFSPVPAMMRRLVFRMAQKSQVRRLEGQGLGSFSREEYQDMGKTVIDHLSAQLGKDSYFGGQEPREIDCVALSFIANALVETFETPLSGYLASRTNLSAYHRRMMQEVFPEFA